MPSATQIELPPNVVAAFETERQDGETVLWSGRAIGRYAWTELAPADVESRAGRAIAVAAMIAGGFLVLCIGLLLIGVCVEIMFTAEGFDLGFLWLLLFLPISVGVVALGCVAIAAPFVTMRVASNRIYLVTDRRAFIIIDSHKGVDIKRFDLATMQPARTCRLVENGVGDLVFGYKAVQLGGGDADVSNAFFDTGFTAVPNAEAVCELIEQARIARRQQAELETIAMQDDYQGYLKRTGQL